MIALRWNKKTKKYSTINDSEKEVPTAENIRNKDIRNKALLNNKQLFPSQSSKLLYIIQIMCLYI